MQGGSTSNTPTGTEHRASPASTEPKPTPSAHASPVTNNTPSESTREKVRDFNRESREHMANSPDIPAPRSDETGPL